MCVNVGPHLLLHHIDHSCVYELICVVFPTLTNTRPNLINALFFGRTNTTTTNNKDTFRGGGTALKEKKYIKKKVSDP